MCGRQTSGHAPLLLLPVLLLLLLWSHQYVFNIDIAGHKAGSRCALLQNSAEQHILTQATINMVMHPTSTPVFDIAKGMGRIELKQQQGCYMSACCGNNSLLYMMRIMADSDWCRWQPKFVQVSCIYCAIAMGDTSPRIWTLHNLFTCPKPTG